MICGAMQFDMTAVEPELESGRNFSTRPEPDPCCPKPDLNPTSEIKTRFWPENFLITVGYVSVLMATIVAIRVIIKLDIAKCT